LEPHSGFMLACDIPKPYYEADVLGARDGRGVGMTESLYFGAVYILSSATTLLWLCRNVLVFLSSMQG
jgi:hypothetical protein